MGQRLAPFAIAIAVFLLDRATKWIIKTHLSLWDTLTVVPGSINMVHTENPGIAFGLLANSPSGWRDVLLIGFSIAVLVGISTILLRAGRNAHSQFLRTGLALVLGGALGNLYDRIVNGTVTDFLELHAGQSYFFPAFNVADSAITTGACLLLLDMWRSRERKSQPAGVPPAL
jgi:signal peptidase II